MASAQKPTGARRRTTTRAKKPATIDLKATEVKAEAEKAKSAASSAADAKPADVKTSAKTETANTSSDKKFGREAAKSGAKASDAAKTETAKKETAKADSKPSSEKPAAASAKPEKASSAPKSNSGGGMRSGLVGGILGSLATVAGLGVVGQMDSAPSIPLIGSLYEKGAAGTDTGGGFEALTARLDALEATGGSSSAADLSGIEERIAKLETAPAAANPEVKDTLSTLEGELASLKETVNSNSSAVSNASATPAVNNNGLEAALAKITELEAGLANLAQSDEIDLSPLETKLAEVETGLSSLNETVSSNSEGVAALNAQSSSLEETVASVKQSEKVAKSVAVNALGAALDNDDPLGLALASVKSLIGETPETARLGALEEQGIPSRKALLDQLSDFTNSLQNPQQDISSGSVSDRFWGSMQNLVTFRSSGPQEGDSTVAILSRVKANLETGDLSALLSEWQKLPQEVQTSGEAFQANVKTRLEAHAIYEKLNGLLAETAG